MKKLLCLLLTAMLLCVQLTALAEGGYVHVKESITSVFGEGMSLPTDEDEDMSHLVIVALELYSEDISAMLIGYNEDGEYEVTYWSSSLGYNLALATTLCHFWDEMEASLDEGYSLVYAFRFTEDMDRIFIEDAEDAATMYELLLSFFESDEEE